MLDKLSCSLAVLTLLGCSQAKVATHQAAETVQAQSLCKASQVECENQAIAGYLSKDPSLYEESYALLEELCFGKSAVACEALGIWRAGYSQIGFDSRWDDRVQGAANLRFACEHGRGLACTDLGVSYAEGIGVPQDQDLAVKYFGQGCDLDNGRGCANLAFRHGVGAGVPKDSVKEWDLNVRACELNDGLGCTNMGVDLEHNDENEKALVAFRKACELNRLDGCAHYVHMSFKLEEMDSVRASTAYDELCELRESEACIYGAFLALESEDGIELGTTLMAKACSIGNMRGCRILADIYQGEYGGVPNFVKSNHFYEVACNDFRRRGSRSCSKWADNLEQGNGVQADTEKAAAARARARELEE